MTVKQATGQYAPDNSKYGTLTDSVGNLMVTSGASPSTAKQIKGAQAPDGSIYFTLTNGSGTLI